MTRFFTGHRLLGTIALIALVAPAMFLEPRPARAYTLPGNILYFDPISVPVDHTVHIHVVNQFSNDKVDFRAILTPTTPAVGSPVVGALVTLAPGDGSDEEFAFATFAPPSGTVRVPMVATIFVTPTGGGTLPATWSGTIASSVEIVSDKTGLPTAILGGRHILRDNAGSPGPCLFCN
ncbi:MAG: hypothetical protein ABW221_15045 [Vicinamibacteria bacterium]